MAGRIVGAVEAEYESARREPSLDTEQRLVALRHYSGLIAFSVLAYRPLAEGAR